MRGGLVEGFARLRDLWLGRRAARAEEAAA
jgi:hypothetical protein